MALDKEIAQDLIDDFVLSNDDELNTISTQNPALFDATLNALNFLSSRFGTGQKMQIVEKPKVAPSVLPFKDGDKFKVPEEKSEQTYTLKDIDLTNGEVRISWFSLSDKVNKSYQDSIQEVTKRLNEGIWVLVEWYPLKVGYEFINNNNKKITFKITNIDNSGNTTKELEVLVDNDGDKKIRNYELNDFIDNIELGFFSFIKQEPFPYKVGDVFSFIISGNKEIAEIKSIDGEEVTFVYPTINNKLGSMPKSALLDQISRGNWVLVNPSQFELGQIVWDKQQSELVIIGYKTNDTLELVSYRQKRNKSVDTLEEDIKLGASILLKFKVGDNFIDNDGNKYEIYGLTPNSATNVMVIKNGSNTSLLWEYIDNKIIYGEWTLVMPTTPQVTNNPNNIKIGDLIFNEGKVFEILDVNQNAVKMMTSNNTKLTGSLGVLNAKIKDGENIKLAFSIGDTYVNPDGDFYKIMELYPNNERSLYVKVNENPNLELFQWDLLEDFVSDGYWVRGTKADADKIKANLSQAKPNATQAMMAKATATPTKTPKKRLTKLEKEIKDLQEEIDGLLFLADEDDEAKADLEKKLIQIKALKTKKP